MYNRVTHKCIVLCLSITLIGLHLRWERWWETFRASQLPSKLTSKCFSHQSTDFIFCCAVHFRITSQNPRLTLVTKTDVGQKELNK